MAALELAKAQCIPKYCQIALIFTFESKNLRAVQSCRAKSQSVGGSEGDCWTVDARGRCPADIQTDFFHILIDYLAHICIITI